MAYGLFVQTSNGVLQLDSENSERYAHVKSSGTASSFTITSGDLLFIRFPQPSSGSAKYYYLYNTSGNNYVIREFSGGTTAYSMTYVIVGTQVSTSLPSNPDTYGLQVYNADNEITLDSRKYVSNVNFEATKYIEPNTLRGYGVSGYDSGGDPSDALITSNFSDYVHFNWSYHSGTFVKSRGVEVGNNYITNSVSYTGVFFKDSETFGQGLGTFYYPNNSEIILGGTYST